MPGLSGHPNSFKPAAHTMATTRRQWPRSDNNQIKWSLYKRFIASDNKARPWSSPRGRLAASSTAWSPSFLLRASQPSKGLGHKNSNEIGWILSATFQAEKQKTTLCRPINRKRKLRSNYSFVVEDLRRNAPIENNHTKEHNLHFQLWSSQEQASIKAKISAGSHEPTIVTGCNLHFRATFISTARKANRGLKKVSAGESQTDCGYRQ